MNTRLLLTTASWLLLAVAAARAEAFIRPSVIFADPTIDGASGTTGFGFSAGVRLGDAARHEFGIDGAAFSWSDSPTPHGWSIHEQVRFRSALLSYRYYVRVPHLPGRVYLNPAIGGARTQAAASVAAADWSERVAGTHWSACAAAGLGITLPLGKHAEIEVGYRFVQVFGRAIRVTGERIQIRIDDPGAHLLHVGAAWKF